MDVSATLCSHLTPLDICFGKVLTACSSSSSCVKFGMLLVKSIESA